MHVNTETGGVGKIKAGISQQLRATNLQVRQKLPFQIMEEYI